MSPEYQGLPQPPVETQAVHDGPNWFARGFAIAGGLGVAAGGLIFLAENASAGEMGISIHRVAETIARVRMITRVQQKLKRHVLLRKQRRLRMLLQHLPKLQHQQKPQRQRRQHQQKQRQQKLRQQKLLQQKQHPR